MHVVVENLNQIFEATEIADAYVETIDENEKVRLSFLKVLMNYCKHLH